MKLDQSIMKRMDAFSKRVGTMRQVLASAHQQLREVADHKDFKHVGVEVSPLNVTWFDVTFAGVALTVRFLPEMDKAGAAFGKLHFYEKSANGVAPERLIGSIQLKPNGMSDLTDEDGDGVDLTYYLMEAVLQMSEIVLRQRA